MVEPGIFRQKVVVKVELHYPALKQHYYWQEHRTDCALTDSQFQTMMNIANERIANFSRIFLAIVTQTMLEKTNYGYSKYLERKKEDERQAEESIKRLRAADARSEGAGKECKL